MNKKVFWILGIPFVVLAIAAALIINYLVKQNKEKDAELEATREMAEFAKEQLENEYEQLAMQFDGYNLSIQNDSLVELLSQEQQRVRDLLEELRITKANDTRRINELTKELATLREVMKGYVAQIDSLDRENKHLVAQNEQYRQQYTEVSQKAQDLEQERVQHLEVISRAAMLEINNFKLEALKKNGRPDNHKRIRNTKTLEFAFSVLKNVTAQPGIKTLYLQIRQPNGEVLTKNATDFFIFENEQLPFSIEHEFEYAGEQIDDKLYWQVEEILEPGIYNADFFIDGNMCGSFTFTLAK